MFTLIRGNKEPIVDYRKQRQELYFKNFMYGIRNESTVAIVYHGIMWLTGLNDDDMSSKSCEDALVLCQRVMLAVGELTPRQLMGIFPPEKTYDGEKWGIKDYFTTKAAIDCHGIDTVVGDSADDLLWDWMNRHICSFYVLRMSLTGKLCRLSGMEAPFDRFIRENNLTTYKAFINPVTGNKFIKNDDTGEICRVESASTRLEDYKGW